MDDEIVDKGTGLPINAILEPERMLFRLRKASSGTLNKGAFGVFLPTVNHSSKSQEDDENETIGNASEAEPGTLGPHEEESSVQDEESNGNTTNGKKHTCVSWYLFLEEVIYLHERGLLEAYNAMDEKLEARDLYGMLSDHGIPMAVFLVYLHLRQQTFRVVRYSSERREIIQEQIEAPERAQVSRLGFQLRQAAVKASLPSLSDVSAHLSWDVYPPDVNYLRREPGLPAFSVLVVHHAQPFQFHRIRGLVQENEPVSIKVAAVADTGTVMIFGVTDFGAPSITSQNTTIAQSFIKEEEGQ